MKGSNERYRGNMLENKFVCFDSWHQSARFSPCEFVYVCVCVCMIVCLCVFVCVSGLCNPPVSGLLCLLMGFRPTRYQTLWCCHGNIEKLKSQSLIF